MFLKSVCEHRLLVFSFLLACCIAYAKVCLLSCLSIQPLDNNHERLRKPGKQKYIQLNQRIFTAVNNLSKRKFRAPSSEWTTPWSPGTDNDLPEPTGCSHKQQVLYCSTDYHVCHGGIKNHRVLVESINAI